MMKVHSKCFAIVLLNKSCYSSRNIPACHTRVWSRKPPDCFANCNWVNNGQVIAVWKLRFQVRKFSWASTACTIKANVAAPTFEQGQPEQSCDCFQFNSTSVPKIRNTPSSKWSSLRWLPRQNELFLSTICEPADDRQPRTDFGEI